MELRPYGFIAPIPFPILDPVTQQFKAGLAFSAGQWKFAQYTAAGWSAFANVTNLPIDLGQGLYAWTPTAAEMQAKLIILKGWDGNTPPSAWAEQSILIGTGDDPNALYWLP